MNSSVKQKTDLMVQNFHQLKIGFKWDTNLVKHFAAMVYATKDRSL